MFSIGINLFLPVNANTYNVIGLISSVPTNQRPSRYILSTMNVMLLAASLVKGGAKLFKTMAASQR
jgi:hypothetical protein